MALAASHVNADSSDGTAATHTLHLQDQSLVGRKIERFDRDDDPAVEMCADRHHTTSLFQYRHNHHVFTTGTIELFGALTARQLMAD